VIEGRPDFFTTTKKMHNALRDRRRVIEETEHFVALVPFAAAGPFEMHLLPLRHEASFARAEARELAELASLLPCAVRRLKAVVGDAPYNFIIDSAITTEPIPYLHWRLRIVPELVVPGGFELGAGLPINPSQPEEDAKHLRATERQASPPVRPVSGCTPLLWSSNCYPIIFCARVSCRESNGLMNLSMPSSSS